MSEDTRLAEFRATIYLSGIEGAPRHRFDSYRPGIPFPQLSRRWNGAALTECLLYLP